MGEKKLKVAIACDWLTNVGGAEKVLLKIHQMFPDAPIYTSKYDPSGIDWFKDADVRTGWLKIFPTKMRRLIAPLRQIYFNHLDLSEYDLDNLLLELKLDGEKYSTNNQDKSIIEFVNKIFTKYTIF